MREQKKGRMPRSPLHALIWSKDHTQYELSTHGHPEQRFRPGDEELWLNWLEASTSFAFQGASGRLNVYKEARPRGGLYWYAYHTTSSGTRKRYLGRTANVTFARLEEEAKTLTRVLSPVVSPSDALPAPGDLLLTTRLFPPRLPAGLVERSRLLTRLDAALVHKLAVVQAPAGFGKTTAVSRWIAERCTQSTFPTVAWLTLDTSDNDPLRFWRSVIVACQKWQESVGQTALAHLTSAMRPPFEEQPLDTVLALLLNDMVQCIQSGLLILDDYHVIAEPRIHETLISFLDHLPRTVSVLVLTRGDPPFPLLRWRAKGELYELHSADLRFSSEEAVAFLSQALGQTLPMPLSEAARTRLDVSLAGWVAGLRLLTLALRGRQTQDEVEHYLLSLDVSPPHQSLLDYFVTEILNAQPEALQLFLLETSALGHLSGSLCNAIIDSEKGAALLETVGRAGLFLEALDGSGEWYRYHALFAQALRQEAALRLGEEALRTLSRRSSSWYEQHGLSSEAIEAALLARDLERGALLIEQADPDRQNWGPQTLCRWLAQIPEPVLRAHPALCLDYAWALRFPQEGKEEAPTPVEVGERIDALLQMAEESWRHQGKPALIGGIYAFRVMASQGQEPLPRVMEYAQQALVLLPDDDPDHLVQAGRGVCLSFVGLGKIREGRYSEAREDILQAHACSLVVGDKRFTRQMIMLLGLSTLMLGELHQAAEYYHQVLSAVPEQEDREDRAQALLGLAMLSFEWNDLAAIEQQTREALALMPDNHDIQNRGTLLLALLQHARGQTLSAQQQLAALLARLQAESTPWALWILPDVLIWQARLHLATGNLQAVQQGLETLTRSAQLLDFTQHLKRQILHARLLLAQEQATAARTELEHLLSTAQQRRLALEGLEIRLLLALAHAACRQKQAAHQWLTQVLIQTRSERFLRLFLDEGEVLAHLLRQLVPALQDTALRSYAQTILRAFAVPGEADAPVVSAPRHLLVEPLSAQEQRVLRLLVSGRTNQQIAQALVVSVNTVKHHVKRLYSKLGVSTRLEASEAARHLKLL
ncbi:ATP-dependent transcriptional regulator, MalT-like, LuxR family [Ktedonobacter racemifer DSM 44963]|uniref:ATP-dependent transcriptional regulator, MalT-like, LuxR family n=2 Tax=Ktedonobacter racemifer TaxID=363277 RepID=D6TYL9_KTERA|nr:ATP-dependent transcriptional regulator, MalT-like, LuxR family [Ktedonobacter racemifer DSM 44963]